MSSATSTDSPGVRPWQFFVLAGMLGAAATVIVSTGQPAASIVTLSLTVVSASLAGLGAYRTFPPLLSPDSTARPQLVGGRTRAALEREKTLVLRSIKELEFDFAMGKIAKSDFEEMSARLRGRAIALLRQLDSQSSYRAIIERELADRLRKEPVLATSSPDLTTQKCSSCGVTSDADARFCRNCGTKLVVEA